MTTLSYLLKMMGAGLLVGFIAHITLLWHFAKEGAGEKATSQGLSRKEYIQQRLFPGRIAALYLSGVALGFCVAAFDSGSSMLRILYGACFIVLIFLALSFEYKGRAALRERQRKN